MPQRRDVGTVIVGLLLFQHYHKYAAHSSWREFTAMYIHNVYNICIGDLMGVCYCYVLENDIAYSKTNAIMCICAFVCRRHSYNYTVIVAKLCFGAVYCFSCLCIRTSVNTEHLFCNVSRSSCHSLFQCYPIYRCLCRPGRLTRFGCVLYLNHVCWTKR